MMGMHKLTAGSGHDYLTRQVARNDEVGSVRTPLADYYDEKGEAPGVWLGSGLSGIEGLKAGDVVTAEQMESLYGKGLHPLAAQRLALLGPDATEQQRRDAVRLGRPYLQPDTRTSLFRQELHRRHATWNRDHGHKPTAKLPDEVRARMRTELAVEWFTAMEHRAPNARELSGFITRMSRPPATPVAGYDLTFSPVKSVSSLWAIADRQTAALIEKAHWAAVTDALKFIEVAVLKTRKGHAGVEQVDVTGLVAAAFTHRDNRAGDPDLHTHVAVANKVQTVADGQWRAIDGRAMHKAITAASETYNTALEAHLGAALGLRFVDVLRVHRDGALGVRDRSTNRRLTLPAAYVGTHVELGYATTIHGAQGMTADTCHGLLTGQESRQQLYTMLSRGRHANHAYLQITGDGDPHNRLSPQTVEPATPTERLEAVLARSEVATSATTQLSELRDPRTLLAAAVACYHDAIVTAAEHLAGADLIALLDHTADTLGLADADAWPAARSHLLILNAQDVSPISALQYAVNSQELDDARDPAAVVDRRLDVVSLRAENDERRPLPWLPAVPDKLLAEPEWRRYLAARWALVADLAERVQQDTATDQTVPGWAASLVEPPTADTLPQIEVWRAAHGIPDTDLRPTGPAQHHLVEARSQHHLDSLIAGESEAVLAWLNRIHQAAPGTIEDPATIRLARECAAVDPKGRGLPKHLAAAAREPLPDDHKADALRFRLEPWLVEIWETAWPPQQAHTDPRRHEPIPLSRHRSPGIGI